MLFYEKLEVSVAKLNKANLKKTLYYLQRNGLRETWISVRERLTDTDRYFFVPCSEAELEKQSRRNGKDRLRSVLWYPYIEPRKLI